MNSSSATSEAEASHEFVPEPVADAAPISKLGQRDAAIALGALSLWAAADAWYASSGLGFAALLGTLDGIVVGVVLARMAHEWGHFAGARWAGGIAPTRSISSFFPIFTLDLEQSSQQAFRAMSVGGNVGHWLVVVVLGAAIPLDTTGRIALFAGSFGFAIFASVTELPIIWRAYSGASPVESFAGLSREKLRRNRWIGVAAGGLLLLGL